MRSREEIKQNAKRLLSQNYGGIMGEFVLMAASFYVTTYILMLVFYFGIFATAFFAAAASIGTSALSVSMIVYFSLFILLIYFLVCLVFAPVEVGYCERLKLLWRGEKKKIFFSGFVNGRYWRSFLSISLTFVFTFLWSLLLYVPGVIKFLSYSMTPFIISESENITPKQAINISKKITYGYKADIFLLYLSFIGWGILSVFTAYLLILFYVGPYYMTSLAGYYEDLKAKALEDGVVTLEDFGYQM